MADQKDGMGHHAQMFTDAKQVKKQSFVALNAYLSSLES
jgi:hypothetical protein